MQYDMCHIIHGDNMNKAKFTNPHKSFLKSYGLKKIDYSDIVLFKFKSEEHILRQGYEVRHLLFILSGKLKVMYAAPNGRQLLLCSYESGIIGDIEMMLGDYEAKSSVQAISDTVCIGIPFDRYETELKSNIDFMNKLGEGIAQKLNQSSRNSAVNILHSLEARLCSYIALTSVHGYFEEKKTVISEMLGTSYRHLLRTLDKLCEKGVLKKAGKGYRISNQSLLKEIGDDYYLI